MKCSYSKDDVTLLIKDLTGLVKPVSLKERQRRVENGEFERSIMIKEYPVSHEYQDVVWASMEQYARQTADAVASVAEQIYHAKGNNLVLASIIRAGIPVGILIKRYLKYKYQTDVPHYAVSLVKGLDANAMKYILNHHDASGIQFIDGWTGKGTVTRELIESARQYSGIDASLAVLSDAIGVSKYCGIRKDIAIPSAPLNATATGLVSITVFNNDLVGKDDFHGAMYLEDLESMDKSVAFIDQISNLFGSCMVFPYETPHEVNEVQKISDNTCRPLSLINPGINEAARAILRRDLEKLLVASENDFDVQCLIKLAKIKHVAVEEYPFQYYKAATIARN